MSAVVKLRRLAEHRERVAKLELAHAEGERVAQEQVVEHAASAVADALHHPGADTTDHLYRHGYALRMEMARRSAERRLIERQREVGIKREAAREAARERGTLDRLVEIDEAERTAVRTRTEQHGLDESGLLGWWRRAS